MQPWAADLFADADLQVCCPSVRVSNYPDEFCQILAQSPAGGWMYTGALENYPRLIERMEIIRPLMGVSARQLVRVRDPWQVAAVLARQDVPCPALAADAHDLPADGTWLRKVANLPVGCKSAYGTTPGGKLRLIRPRLRPIFTSNGGSRACPARRSMSLPEGKPDWSA